MNEKIMLKFLLGDDGRSVVAMETNAPLDLVFEALLRQKDPNIPRVLVTVDIMPSAAAKAPERTGVMDPALKSRAECLLIDTLAANDMLSILSDKFLGGK